jgi:hypothetical protein
MNIEKKRKDKESHKKRCLEGQGVVREHKENTEDENDREWYRKEVGEEPDEDEFGEHSGQRTSERRPGKRRSEGHRGDGLGSLEMRPRISKFTKVKEKAKLIKLERQKNAARGRGRESGGRRGGNFKASRDGRKGDGTYSKPGRGKGMGSKVQIRVSAKRGSSRRGGGSSSRGRN